MPEDLQTVARPRPEGAIEALIASPVPLANDRTSVVEDALALLHQHLRAAPSLNELRWIARQTRLRETLCAQRLRHESMPFLHSTPWRRAWSPRTSAWGSRSWRPRYRGPSATTLTSRRRIGG